MNLYSFLSLAALLFSAAAVAGATRNGSFLAGIEFPDPTSFDAASPDCTGPANENLNLNLDSLLSPKPGTNQALKLHLNRRTSPEAESSVASSTRRDSSRIQTLHRRITANKTPGGKHDERSSPAPGPDPEEGSMVATLESGVGFGSGEYFMDVFIGTPARHFSMILDTGSDLNWIQCAPCHDCFEQIGPHYNPVESSSYRNVSCADKRCGLVAPPESAQPCSSTAQPCPYYYWYGDSSNTTGDFALEAFTVNLTSAAGTPEVRRVEGVMFGCGHWNRGLFRGAAGLLGLGRGPLSFASQLQSLYGRSFSYCLVDRDSPANLTSKLVFGRADLPKPLNFTAFVAGNNSPTDTFYYLDLKSVSVGGEVLRIPEGTWRLSAEGVGGTIVDSGTTLSYFVEPAYEAIKEAFLRKVSKGYRRVMLEDFPLDVCYNVSGVEKVELPGFSMAFSDGAVWSFPVENYFIQVEPQEVVCLAFKNTSSTGMSIIGNYQQQNFYVLYDTDKSRLGYAPVNCAEV